MVYVLSTFPSGLQEPVGEALRSTLAAVKLILNLDGMITYNTSDSLNNIKSLRFVSNSFLVLHQFGSPGGVQVASVLRHLASDTTLNSKLRSSVGGGERTFRIIASVENTTISVDRNLLGQAESRIIEATGLRPNRVQPDTEYWCYTRSEGYGFLMKRLTRRAASEKDLQRGELRPELANILCLISEPKQSDVFLDPFCGHGAIPAQRVTMPHNLIFASDSNIDLVKILRYQIKMLSGKNKLLRKMIVSSDNALALSRFQDGFIDKVVTDPPWGSYTSLDMEPRDFYSRMLDEMRRVVKPGGIIVILMGEKHNDIFDNIIYNNSNKLYINKKYYVLISGKKSIIYKILAN